jgi:hypothetical protein
MAYGVISTLDNNRDLIHRDGIVVESRSIPRDGWQEWVEARRGLIDYLSNTITWSDGSKEWLEPLPL